MHARMRIIKISWGYNLMGPLVNRHQLAYALVIWAAAINFELGAMAILWCRSVGRTGLFYSNWGMRYSGAPGAFEGHV